VEYKPRSATMSILVDSNTRLVVQGITGREGAKDTAA
jgi:succinyl-CoA synthetase alpha subunit